MVYPVKGVNTCVKCHTAEHYQSVQHSTSSHIPLVRKNVTTEEKQQQAEAKKIYDKCMKNGQLVYNHPKESFWTRLLGIKEEASYTYTPNTEKSETFGELKRKLNLPDGTFAEYLQGYNGVNRDVYTIADPVPIQAKVLHKAIGK